MAILVGISKQVIKTGNWPYVQAGSVTQRATAADYKSARSEMGLIYALNRFGGLEPGRYPSFVIRG
jgi:hypothetical protein